MRKRNTSMLLQALLAALIVASLIPLASCGGTNGADKGPEPGVSQAASTAEEAQAQLAQDQEPASPSPQEEAISALQDAGNTASALAADPARAATDTEALKASVAANTAKLAGTISQAGDKLTELGLEGKQERFAEESSKVLAAIDRVKAASSGLSPEDPASYNALSQVVGEAFASPEPAILSADLSHRSEPDTPVPPTYGASIAPAYLAGSPGLTPSSLPAEPGDEDLAETPDAPQTEEITALASQLGNDPVAIYEWVRNNIDFESCYGSRKGALGCLKEMAGNSTDTASLLIALYRASGIPARYVTGVVELAADQACSWLATDTISDAQSLLAAGGIPVTGIVEAGAVSKLQLTQTWTEAYVNYSNYRGAEAGEGPSSWIPLDASYKVYEVYQPEVDILSVMGASYETLSAEYLSTVRDDTFLSFIEGKVKAWLSANMPQLTLADVMRTKSIKQENLGILPPDLLYKSISAEAEERELPASSRWTATLNLAGITLNCDLISLSAGALEVSFTPTATEDEALLSAYENIEDIPAYLLDMTGEITAGEQAVQTQSHPFGSSSSWSMTISSPGRSYRIDNTLTWGAPFSVALEREPSPVNHSLTMQTSDRFPHCLFNQAASTYISNCASDDQDLASLYGLAQTRGTQEVSVGLSLAPKCVAGVSVSAVPDGVYIDADLSTATPSGKSKVNRRDFTLTSGLSGSAYEHLVLGDCFSSEAVSAVKLISLANACEIPVLTLDRNNWASLSPSLELPAYIKAQMADSVQAGYVVTTPIAPNSYMDCVYEGWMVTDPQTGEGAYLISGGLSGGKVVEWNEVRFPDKIYVPNTYLSSCEIIEPENGMNVLKGEKVRMVVNWHFKSYHPQVEEFDYQTNWNIDTKKDCYKPGTFILKSEIKLYDQVLYADNVSINIFGLLKMKNDGMWVPPESEQNVQVQAVDYYGSSIQGLYSSGNEYLPVETFWEWEDSSFAQNARFLDTQEQSLTSSLDSGGRNEVGIKIGDVAGKYIVKHSTKCPFFISWEDRNMFLKDRTAYPVSEHPIENEIYAFPGVGRLVTMEVRILDGRYADTENGDNISPDQFVDAYNNHRIYWGEVVGIINSGEEPKVHVPEITSKGEEDYPSRFREAQELLQQEMESAKLEEIVIGVSIEFDECDSQTGPDLIPINEDILKVSISSHIQRLYDDIGSVSNIDVNLQKVVGTEVDMGSCRTVYLSSGKFKPTLYINQDKNDSIDEYTVINGMTWWDHSGTRRIHNADHYFESWCINNGYKRRGLVDAVITEDVKKASDLKTSEEITFSRESDMLEEFDDSNKNGIQDPGEPGKEQFMSLAVNLLRAGGGVEVLEVNLDAAECQTYAEEPYIDKVLVRNPTDIIYILAHGDEEGRGFLGRSYPQENDQGAPIELERIKPPSVNLYTNNNNEWFLSEPIIDNDTIGRLKNELFYNSLADVETVIFQACDVLRLGWGFNFSNGSMSWLSTGADNLLGYFSTVFLDSADNVIINYKNTSEALVSKKWLCANIGDNSYRAIAIRNFATIDMPRSNGADIFDGPPGGPYSYFCVWDGAPRWAELNSVFQYSSTGTITLRDPAIEVYWLKKPANSEYMVPQNWSNLPEGHGGQSWREDWEDVYK